MYNSSLKGQGEKAHYSEFIEIPNKVFFNDMSKTYIREEFKTCDCIYSDIAWRYGYPIFNTNAGNTPERYDKYCTNINRLIEELNIPAFITAGKEHRKYFKNAKSYDILLDNSGTHITGVKIYVWNYKDINAKSTSELINQLCKEFKKALDFSCGYGEHLMKFEDFVGCDIDKNCLTYLSMKIREVT